jgi:hypothetical protein
MRDKIEFFTALFEILPQHSEIASCISTGLGETQLLSNICFTNHITLFTQWNGSLVFYY